MKFKKFLRNTDIIIGTQLVAKGHNFPKLRLVGVIDIDIGLHGSDLRAAERTYQLVRQVSEELGEQIIKEGFNSNLSA